MSQTKFDQLAGKLAKKPDVADPKALAASIGRGKLGAKTFNARAAAGRRKKKHPNAAFVQQYLKKK